MLLFMKSYTHTTLHAGSMIGYMRYVLVSGLGPRVSKTCFNSKGTSTNDTN